MNKPAVTFDIHGSLRNLGEMLVRRRVEPALGGRKIWDRGMSDVVDTALAESGMRKSFTLVDVARELGLLKRRGER